MFYEEIWLIILKLSLLPLLILSTGTKRTDLKWHSYENEFVLKKQTLYPRLCKPTDSAPDKSGY